jgi:DNA repair exonuclease SbcCD ATPase subunit
LYSEQGLEETRERFQEALLYLKKIETLEQLEAHKPKLEALKQRLLEIDPEFKKQVERKKAKIREEAAKRKAEHDAKMTKMQSMRGHYENYPVVAIKIPKDPKERLFCPICGAEGKGNMINGELVCCHDQKEFGRWHKLVKKSELKDYNRAYKRRWLRRR